MSRRVTFYLGPAVSLTSRRVTITRMMAAGDTSATTIHDVTLGGTVENYSVVLPDNAIFQAKLVDTRSSGEVSNPAVMAFNTGSLQFPGPACADIHAALFRLLSMEDKSSSSSSVTSSSSSKSSATSSSSSSSSSSGTSSSSVTSSSSSSSRSSATSSSSSSSRSSISTSSNSSSSSSKSSGTSSSSSSNSSSSSSSL